MYCPQGEDQRLSLTGFISAVVLQGQLLQVAMAVQHSLAGGQSAT
jgi:hypothetical protein